MPNAQPTCVDIPLVQGGTLRVQPLTAHSFRIRLAPDGRFHEPALIRYGILRNEWATVDLDLEEHDTYLNLLTEEACLSVSKEDGRLLLADRRGQTLLQESAPPRSDRESGFEAQFELQEGERLYGLGDETRDRLQKRGHRTQMWVRNVACYAPIPYLMSTKGWAILLNTTWRHFFDLGYEQADRLRFWSRGGELDYTLIVGASLPQLLDRYTDIAGKPTLLPLWGYGLTFVCNQQANAREMLDDCLNFRREGIPCDLIGLEPGWMSKHYDFSVEKTWHPERFAIPNWAPRGPHTFLGAAARLGFKVSLWLCCDYDLSYAEEAQAPATDAGVQEAHPDDFERDEHFGHHPVLMDKLTRPQEPWFEHLKQFVDQGVSAFKMDGANQVNEHPDRKWGNGMDDEQMHNLYPVLLSKQMSLGFQEHTERRSMIYSSGGYLGIQQYAATWAGDTGGGPKPLISILNHGLSGHSNASCDMDVFTPEGIHFGFLMPWSQVCSWAYWRHPWLLGEHLGSIFKFYARLRYRLIPYIYSMAHVAYRRGMPILRSMNLMFPEDPECENCLNQYMFGEAFLVGAFTDTLYLPQGEWLDYWTGKRYQGGQTIRCDVPSDRGGPLFVRAGAIIPYWPEMDYVGQKPVETLGLYVYPGGENTFTLYEDDGISLHYREGSVATSTFTCSTHPQGAIISLGPREGRYDGMPERRTLDVWYSSATPPARVALNGEPLSASGREPRWEYDEVSGFVRVKVPEEQGRTQELEVLLQ